MGNILTMAGKPAGPGLPVLYHLNSGQILYSEEVGEDGDSYIFDGDRTCIVAVGNPDNKGQVRMDLMKLSTQGFQSKAVRIMKHAVASVTDCGQPALVDKCHECLSGLSIASGGSIN